MLSGWEGNHRLIRKISAYCRVYDCHLRADYLNQHDQLCMQHSYQVFTFNFYGDCIIFPPIQKLSPTFNTTNNQEATVTGNYINNSLSGSMPTFKHCLYRHDLQTLRVLNVIEQQPLREHRYFKLSRSFTLRLKKPYT